MKALLLDIHQCQLCQSTLPLGAQPLLQASEHSKILIAGQAPGRLTHINQQPFADKSGQRLRQWLSVSESQFYDPTNFAIVPMAFCYPGRGKSGDLPPPSICAQTWRAKLLTKMPNIQLTIILGKYACDWHVMPQQSITEHCQNWHSLLQSNKLVLPHPSPRNNRWLKANPWFEQSVIPALKSRIHLLIND